MKIHVTIETRVVSGYSSLKATYKGLEQIKSEGGKNFPQLHTHIMRFKSWLKGIHHHCSGKYIQGYLDEFHFRFNRRNFLDTLLDKLLPRRVEEKPLFMTLREANT